MSVLSALDTTTCDRLRGNALPPPEPIVFDTFSGTFQAALGRSDHPVLMVGSFGYEELCSRAFSTTLADTLARAGTSSLRFDFPGTGNALDPMEPQGLEDWWVAARAAADALRRRTGAFSVVLLGQGLGGTLALAWANDLGPVSELVLLEPAASGRAYLRGLKAWGKTIAAAMSIPYGTDEAADHAVAGFAVPPTRAAAIRDLDVTRLAAPAVDAVLVLEQAGGAVGRHLESQVGDRAYEVARHGFSEYPALVTDPTASAMPQAALDTIVTWVSSRARDPDRNEASVPPVNPARATLALQGDGFEERPIRFGQDGRIAGVLCLPRNASTPASALVIVSAGRDHSIGWARSSVIQARAFARQGVASLRFDVGGIGDSRAAADAPDEILYSPRMCDDLRAAVDHLDALGHRSIGLLGRCSGAWAAFTLATADDRISRVALVNVPYFIWDSSKTLADVVRFSQRSVGDLGTTLLRRHGLKRLLRGQLDLRGACRFLVRKANLHILRRMAPYLGRMTTESRRYHDLHGHFARLRKRNVPMLLAYAAGDSSLNELRSFMGGDLGALQRFPNIRFREIEGADHNFTPHRTRTALLADLQAFFATPGRPAAPHLDAKVAPRARAAQTKSAVLRADTASLTR